MTNITKLPDGHYFVFGSNEAGRHGKGAALTAKALGYEFILWNGKVYRACGVETLYTEKDIQ